MEQYALLQANTTFDFSETDIGAECSREEDGSVTLYFQAVKVTHENDFVEVLHKTYYMNGEVITEDDLTTLFGCAFVGNLLDSLESSATISYLAPETGRHHATFGFGETNE